MEILYRTIIHGRKKAEKRKKAENTNHVSLLEIELFSFYEIILKCEESPNVEIVQTAVFRQSMIPDGVRIRQEMASFLKSGMSKVEIVDNELNVELSRPKKAP